MLVDFQGSELSIGDSIVFISAPNFLNKGTVTGFREISKQLTVVAVAVTNEKATTTLTVAPFLCAKMS